MTERLQALLQRLHEVETDIEQEVARHREELQVRLTETGVQFEQSVLARQKALRRRLGRYVADAPPLFVLTTPVIYAGIVPFLLLDLFVTLYQWICFPVYGIAKVRRAEHLVFDRGSLAYLNLIEKLNCAYCSYGNGVLAYAREIAARTEQYWCPIKHARRVLGSHPHYRHFTDYGDAQAWLQELERLRRELAPGADNTPPQA
ncbi:hypothetical protein KGA65_07405 [Ideonella sp. B7]|uniref:hypothetical protein n=1 Tax=Ideonella benzenivorans TaxID=2831643 RepID=UPI001CEDD479|nr:hypothetical protein [Ideonella benzenivorans]MCA6216362.1 hypothetical protein [Ideonella benzenivorans]